MNEIVTINNVRGYIDEKDTAWLIWIKKRKSLEVSM